MLQKFIAASTYSQPSRAVDQVGFDEEPLRIGLALTGGGSHGAFEAGVLEAILPALHQLSPISVITGTSAGAVNAIAAGSGLNASGPDEAIHRLRDTWAKVSANGNPHGRGLRFFSDAFLPQHQKWPNVPTLPFSQFGLSRGFQDFMPSFTAQFISATARQVVGDWTSEVQNGAVTISINTMLESRHKLGEFEHIVLSGSDLTPDGVGASANLKQLGVHYIKDSNNPNHSGRRAYDGAYQENGPLEPHLNNRVTDCIMIVLHDRRHNELDKMGALKHAEIHSHALNLLSQDSYSPIRLHAIEIESMGGEIGGLPHMDDSSKMNVDAEFVNMLYQAGLKAGQNWLEKNANYIGQMSSYRFYQPALKQLTEFNYA